MNLRKIICIAFLLLALGVTAACNDSGRIELEIETESLQTEPPEEDEVVDISLSDIQCDGEYYNITAPGTYRLYGNLTGGVRVEVEKSEKVKLILDGADISNSSGAALYIATADKVTLTLAEGGENILSDGSDYSFKGSEPNACLFSKDDLTIDGGGSLSVIGHCNNGIGTKNDLKILSGTISVTAPKNAIKGNDSVEIGGGNITVTGCKDGIKSDNETDERKGFVAITGGNISLTCADDGIQAFRRVNISGCSLSIAAGDKTVNCDGDVNIAEGCMG